MKVWLGKDIQMKLAAEGLCIPMVKGTADAIQNPFYKALALEVNHSDWICSAMDQLLGRDTGRVFNDEARVKTRRSIDKAEAISLRAQAIHPNVAVIAFNLACYASVTARFEEAESRLQHAIELDKEIRTMPLDDEDLRPLWEWIAHLH